MPHDRCTQTRGMPEAESRTAARPTLDKTTGDVLDAMVRSATTTWVVVRRACGHSCLCAWVGEEGLTPFSGVLEDSVDGRQDVVEIQSFIALRHLLREAGPERGRARGCVGEGSSR